MDQQSDGITRAPWAAGQVASLNAYQKESRLHPFTCGESDCRAGAFPEQAALVAHEDGWRCPRCQYTQNWAHTWMADESWRQPADRMTQMAAFMSTTHGSAAPGDGWRR
jgi:ribosomal protein S27AE